MPVDVVGCKVICTIQPKETLIKYEHSLSG